VNPETQGPNPNSHYPAYERAWEAIVEALDLRPLEFHARKGQALIWAANLLHGGAAQTDKSRTRYSQVTHYYFEGCCYYTPSLSVPFLGATYFRDIVDINTGQKVPNTLNATQVPRAHIEYSVPKRHQVRPIVIPPDFDDAAYLRANPDVAAAKADPRKHWVEYGYREGRPLR
jgi:hypothetical protein